MTPEQLVAELQQAIGSNLKSVVLYVSAVAGDFVPGVSGRDILIVADRLGATELAALSSPLKRWQQGGNPLPQLFTPQELTNSTDAFPIELSDMQQSRRVLFGADPLTDLAINMQCYRVQLERDLKTRLLQLRRSALECSGNEERIAGLMVASVSTFLVLLRAILRLYNDPVPVEKAEVLDRLAKHIELDVQPFRTVLELKSRKGAPAPGEMADLFHQYLSSIEHVVHAVDQKWHPSSQLSQQLPAEDSHE
jgi:hypothetical protein